MDGGSYTGDKATPENPFILFEIAPKIDENFVGPHLFVCYKLDNGALNFVSSKTKEQFLEMSQKKHS